MGEPAENVVVDPGLDESIKKLTPEQIETTINKVLTKETAARLNENTLKIIR